MSNAGLRFVIGSVVAFGLSGAACADECVGREFYLPTETAVHTVPENHIWKISGLSPYVSERGVGTADLYVKGQVQVGESRAYTMYGEFDILINEPQTSPIWVLAGSSLSVGDSRQRVRVEECLDEGA